MNKSTNKTKKDRVIVTNIKDCDSIKKNLLYFLAVQLSDGYWENEENFYEEFWNWLNFDVVNNNLVVKVKVKPTWANVKDIFSDKTDEEVVHYIGLVLEDCYEQAPSLFESDFEDVITGVIDELKNYREKEILTMKNITKEFLNLPQDEKEKVINNLVPSVCSTYCCRDNCDGCFIQELTDETLKTSKK